MTQNEFIDMVLWNKQKLWEVCNDITSKHGHISALNILMKTRRNLQEQLAKYSKGKSQIDGIQKRAIWMTEMISKWCSQYYKQWATTQIIKNDPHMATQAQKVKGLAGSAWEQYLKKMSY